MSEVLEKIRSRGYWRVLLRPAAFSPQRIADYVQLQRVLEACRVSLRGWDFPHLDLRVPVLQEMDSISQETEWQHHLDVWRFFQSGQFIAYRGLSQDWRDQSNIWPATHDWRPGKILGAIDSTFQIVEIFEFGARLALEGRVEAMSISILLGNLRGRALMIEDPNRAPLHDHQTSLQEFAWTSPILSAADLAARPREHALAPTIELFRRFTWDPSLDLLRGFQSQLTR